ncbi:helix-turn-helix domain-containing protein [Paenibacillus alginolyticus]|uniref:Response regulator n=1 Tax=Paenibacillus alginolyticus TaxID=59839 RepID=A0ABT4GKQ2_9BACL|nr:helix-turn-helix domain-containing protein [Paenibacillus alginolyticus]MCY9696780.1 response regulator [Paenibacillus alginolyticus]MEC0148531.1 response regulator [Paenibacillus alginolyticus]
MMIVDDEPLVRLAMHHLIDWQALHIEIVCEAGDGVEGLALLKTRSDVDLLLVDIQMPRMNGIELLKALNDPGLPKRPIPIILSAYSDYSYVREAFLLGAMDYIVKVDMDEEHIIPVITKAVEELMRLGDVSIREEMGQAEKQLVQQSDKDALLHRLLDFDPKEDTGLFEQWLLSANGLLNETNEIAIVIQIARGIDTTKLHGFIQQTIQSVLHEMSILHEMVRREAGEYVLLCAFPHDRSESAIRAHIHSLLTMIQTRLLQYVNASISVGISDLANGCRHWPRLYQQAKQLAAKSYFAGLGKLFYRESATQSSGVKDKGDHALWDDLKAGRLVLLQVMKHPDESQWILEYELLEKRLHHASQEPPDRLRAFFVDVLWELGAVLYAKGIRLEEVQPTSHNPFDEIKQMETLEETQQYVKQLLQRAHSAIHGNSLMNAVRYSPSIANAKKFLDLHYREEINQSLISEMVGVSESYLSKQFVKEVGCNFIHYLTKLRIEEAKQLLEKGIKISDISERIGYLNPEHFSRIFKKMTGFSPKAYRESLGRE